MTTGITILLVLIFLALSGIHFYWALGNSWGFDAALPQNEKGESVLHPTRIQSAIVGIGLLIFGAHFLLKKEAICIVFPTWIESGVTWIIAGIFFLRAVGDFKYVGFLKRITGTKFARRDTRFYSPLCLIIFILIICLEISTR